MKKTLKTSNEKTTKLYSLIGTFTKEERKSALKFLESPFHNSEKKLTQLFVILHQKWEAKSGLPSDEKIFAKLYPGTCFSMSTIRNLRHRLTQKLLGFLAVHTLLGSPETQTRLRLRFFGERQASEWQVREMKRRMTELENQKRKGMEYHEEMTRLKTTEYFHPSTTKYRVGQKNIAEAAVHFGEAMRLQAFCLMAEMKARKTLLGETPLPLIFSETQRMAGQAFPLTELEDFLFQLLNADPFGIERKHHQLLMDKLFRLAPQMGKTEVGIALKILTNMAINRTNRKEPGWPEALFKLNRFALDEEIVFPAGKMDVAWFINFVTTALKVGETEWAEEFIEKYAVRLENKVRESTINLAHAFCFYQKGAPLEALKYLNKVKEDNLFLALQSRTLKLRTWYDGPNDSEYMHLLIRRFKYYLSKSKKIAVPMAKRYRQFLLYLDRLVDLKKQAVGRTKQLDKLAQKIENDPHVAQKEWLKKKVEELGKS